MFNTRMYFITTALAICLSVVLPSSAAAWTETGNLTIDRTAGLAGNFSLSGSGSSGVSSGSSLGTADGTIAGSEIIYVDGVAIASVSSASNGQGTNTLLVNFGSNAIR